MKRQRGRNRSGGGGNSGGGKPQQNVNRAFDSNGPENVKIRGHAQHVFEKYQQLARDAFSSGDRVVAENYLQHADHYFRVLRMLQPQRPASEILGRDVFTSGLDIDFEDEGEGFEEAAAEANAQADAQAAEYGNGEGRDVGGEVRNGRDRQDRNPQERNGQDRDRSDRDRQDRVDRPNDRYEARPERSNERSNERYEPRSERSEQRFEPRSETRNDPRREGEFREGRRTESFEPRRDQRRFEPRRDDRPREDRPRDERPRDERPRDERPREDRPARTDERNREERSYAAREEVLSRDPLAVIEPENAPLTAPAFSETEGSPMLRGQDGSVSEAPAFLQAPAASDDGGEVKRPRVRRRRPKTFDEAGGDDAPTAAVEEA